MVSDRGKTAAAAPKLLSGGNPQIPKGDGRGPVQAYIDAMPGWKQDIGKQLDRVILQAVPDAAMAVRWNTPFYGMENHGWFVAFHCYTKYIKVTFFKGSCLSPMPPVGAKQENVRHLHIGENDEVDEKQLMDWIRQASELPGEKLF